MVQSEIGTAPISNINFSYLNCVSKRKTRTSVVHKQAEKDFLQTDRKKERKTMIKLEV